MDNSIAPEDDYIFMQKAQAIVPGIHRDILREKKKKERILPRCFRRAFRSKNKHRIQALIAEAIRRGFTKEEIREHFKIWQEEQS